MCGAASGGVLGSVADVAVGPSLSLCLWSPHTWALSLVPTPESPRDLRAHTGSTRMRERCVPTEPWGAALNPVRRGHGTRKCLCDLPSGSRGSPRGERRELGTAACAWGQEAPAAQLYGPAWPTAAEQGWEGPRPPGPRGLRSCRGHCCPQESRGPAGVCATSTRSPLLSLEEGRVPHE